MIPLNDALQLPDLVSSGLKDGHHARRYWLGSLIPVLILVALWNLGATEMAEATTVTNYLNYSSFYGWQYSLGVNVGDTVVWVNQWPTNSGTNYVESYGGEWASGPLNSGDTFSFSFTNAGFFAYHTRAPNRPGRTAGTITVVGWTDAPPAVTINTPLDGAVISFDIRVQASVTNPATIAQIEYFADSDLIGTATNWPFAIQWLRWFQHGRYSVVAKAMDRQGSVTWSQPINVIEGSDFNIWGPRLLPTGELLFFYNAIPSGTAGYLAESDRPSFLRDICSPITYTNWSLGEVSFPGVFVDESVRGGAAQMRFYGIVAGRGGACP